MTDDPIYQEALAALNQGQRARARDLLTRLLRTGQGQADYWLLMSATVETHNERLYCLDKALKLDPQNQAVRRGMILLGALPPDEGIKPVPPMRRKWREEPVDEEARRGALQTLQSVWANPRLRPLILMGLGAFVMAVIFLGVLSLQARPARVVKVNPTRIYVPTYTPTLTPTITKTPLFRSPTPTLSGPTPLGQFLAATYTPFPRYVDTPHPLSEAYKIALRAQNRGDYPSMLTSIEQAARDEPSAPDLKYHLGEAYRLNERYDEALAAYDKALDLNPAFAPAYLGRALVLLAQDRRQDVLEDLDQALLSDPNYVEAYLTRAEYFLFWDEINLALDDLETVQTLQPDLPMLYVLRARANIALGDDTAALADAQRAHDLDYTLLPAYLVLAQVHTIVGDYELALSYLHTYQLFMRQDPSAWVLSGLARFGLADYRQAISDFDQALALDDQFVEALHYRGLAYMALENYAQAVNDLNAANKLVRNTDFAISLDFGIALLNNQRPGDAYRQFNATEALAATPDQFGPVYYWRARALETAGNFRAAIVDWEALLALPQGVVPAEWVAEARQKMLALTPSPTVTLSVTPGPEETLTPTGTDRPTTSAP